MVRRPLPRPDRPLLRVRGRFFRFQIELPCRHTHSNEFNISFAIVDKVLKLRNNQMTILHSSLHKYIHAVHDLHCILRYVSTYT